MKPSENVSPASIDRMDTTDTADSEMETMPQGFLKFANFWEHEMKFGNKTQNKNSTTDSKPPKRFPIKNWIQNKFDKKNDNENASV